MRILVAEDDTILRRLLEATLTRSGYEVVLAEDGRKALEILCAEDPPRLAILDWMMPEVDGLEVCRRTRASEKKQYVYVIILTAKGRREDIIEGLEAGADDYLTKPFDPHELRSRVRSGERILALQTALGDKVRELEAALAQVEQLQGLLPICMHCKRIRDEHQSWHRIETYIQEHSEARFTHSLCQECLERHYPEAAASAAQRR
jgi:sigma-B regulation protein RsbU (phosphoserine phosphatase)